MKAPIFLKNLIANYSSAAFNAVSPLFIIPALTKTYSVEDFGIYSLFLAISAVGITFVEFGFPLKGTQALATSNILWRGYFVHNSIVIRICAASFFSVIYGVLCLLGLISLDIYTTIAVFVLLISVAILPLWAINGRQISGKYAYKYISWRIIFTVIFIFSAILHTDMHILIVIYSFGMFLPALICSSGFYRNEPFLRRLRLSYVKKIIFTQWSAAQSSILALATNGSLLIVAGALLSLQQVAQISMADKISKMSLTVFIPLAVSFLPKVSSMFAVDSKKALSKLIFVTILVVIAYSLISLFIYIFSADLYRFMSRPEYMNREFLMLTLIWGGLSLLNNFIGLQYLTVSSRLSLYGKIFLGSVFTQIALFFFMYDALKGVGLILAVTVNELLLTLCFMGVIYVSERSRK